MLISTFTAPVQHKIEKQNFLYSSVSSIFSFSIFLLFALSKFENSNIQILDRKGKISKTYNSDNTYIHEYIYSHTPLAERERELTSLSWWERLGREFSGSRLIRLLRLLLSRGSQCCFLRLNLLNQLRRVFRIIVPQQIKRIQCRHSKSKP